MIRIANNAYGSGKNWFTNEKETLQICLKDDKVFLFDSIKLDNNDRYLSGYCQEDGRKVKAYFQNIDDIRYVDEEIFEYKNADFEYLSLLTNVVNSRQTLNERIKVLKLIVADTNFDSKSSLRFSSMAKELLNELVPF